LKRRIVTPASVQSEEPTRITAQYSTAARSSTAIDSTEAALYELVLFRER